MTEDEKKSLLCVHTMNDAKVTTVQEKFIYITFSPLTLVIRITVLNENTERRNCGAETTLLLEFTTRIRNPVSKKGSVH